MFQDSYFFNILSSFQNSYSGRPGSPPVRFFEVGQARHYANQNYEDNIYYRPENVPQALSYKPVQGAGLPPDFSSLLQAGLLQSQQSENEFNMAIKNQQIKQRQRQQQYNTLFSSPGFFSSPTTKTLKGM
jgi:hypothetical protein